MCDQPSLLRRGRVVSDVTDSVKRKMRGVIVSISALGVLTDDRVLCPVRVIARGN